MKRRIILAVGLMTVILGCSLFKPVYIPEPKRFVVDRVSTHIPVRKKVRAMSILILTPLPDAGSERTGITYMKTPYRMQHYVHYRWVTTPANMVRSVIANSLRKTQRFYSVIEQPQHAKTNFRLATRLLKFQQELFAKTPRVRVAMKADLISNKDSSVIASKLFEVVETSHDESPYNAVLTFNEATAKLAEQITDFTVHYVR